MSWLTFIFSPIGRYLSLVGGVITAVFVIYKKGRKEGIEDLQREQERERARRSRNALEADDSVRRDISSGRLYQNDGHRRD
jgi:hypothetical protein